MKTSQNIQRLNFETFFRSNQDTCLSQRPLVKQGQWIGKGQLLADCINSVSGDLSLGKNVLVAYMPWEGYNFEDSIVISDRLIAEDIYTSIHILRFRTEIVDNLGTKSPSINSKFSLGGEASETKTFSSPASKVPNFLRKPLLFHKTTHSIFLPPVSYAFLPLVSESDRMQGCAYVPVPRRGIPYVPPSLPPSLPPSGVRVRVITEGDRVQVNKGVLSFASLASPVTFGDGVGGTYGQEGVKGFIGKSFENLWGKGDRVPFTPKGYGHRKPKVRRQRIAKLKKPKKPLGILNMFLPLLQTEGKLALPLSSELKSQENSFAFGDGIRPNDLTKLNTTEKRTPKVPFLGDHLLAHLDNNGVAKVGTWVSPGDILVGKVRPLANKLKSSRASTQLAWEIISSKKNEFMNMEDRSFRLPKGVYGRVIKSEIISHSSGEHIYVYLAIKRKIQIGDKLAGRHGNKGIVSLVLPRQDMPYLADGTPIDIILSPLGVPSRMNVGQIYECLLGLAAKSLACDFKINNSMVTSYPFLAEVPLHQHSYVPPTLAPSLPPSGVQVRVITEGNRVITEGDRVITEGDRVQINKGSAYVPVLQRGTPYVPPTEVNEGGRRSSVPLCLPPTLPPSLPPFLPPSGVRVRVITEGDRVRKGKEGVLMQKRKFSSLHQYPSYLRFSKAKGVRTTFGCAYWTDSPLGIENKIGKIQGIGGPYRSINAKKKMKGIDESTSKKKVKIQEIAQVRTKQLTFSPNLEARNLVFLKLYHSRIISKSKWLFSPSYPGKMRLFDGRTGQPFSSWITVGYAYMLKLIHLVDNKMHSRSTGPYSLITRQPVTGKARQGGQRIGEMEAWALEGFGAAYTLQEFFSFKGDDVSSRHQWQITTMSKMVGNTTAFKTLLSELRALCISIDFTGYGKVLTN